MSSDFEAFVDSWLNHTRSVTDGVKADPPGEHAVVEQPVDVDSDDDRVHDDVIHAELAAIRDRARRRSELAHADILYEAGDVAGARELWERVAGSGHPTYSGMARGRLCGYGTDPDQPVFAMIMHDRDNMPRVELTDLPHGLSDAPRCAALHDLLSALQARHDSDPLLLARRRRYAVQQEILRRYAANRGDRSVYEVGGGASAFWELAREKDRAD